MAASSNASGYSRVNRRNILRIALFFCACICIIASIAILVFSSQGQSREEQVATRVINTEPKADVLLLLSYDDSDVLTPMERAGVLDVMRRSSVDVDVEYMDAINRPSNSPARATWTQLLSDKLASHGPYSVLICADDEALGFVDQNRANMFSNAPVVFFGVSDRALASKAVAGGYATGVNDESYFANTMNAATQLMPDANNFLVVVDGTPAGIGDQAQFSKAMASMSGMSADYINASSLTRAQLGQQLSNARKDSIVFFLDAANDVNGNTYTLDENSFFISGATKQPVFRGTIGGVGEGVCGSGFTDLERDGQRAAELAIKVLNGTSPSAIPVETVNKGGYVFDAKALASHGLSADKVPADAVVINKQGFLNGSGGSLVLPIVLLVIGFILMIAVALLSYRRNADSERAMHQRHTELEHHLYKDQLTDVPNMEWLSTKAIVDDADVQSVAKVEIANLGAINDTYGIEMGDAVLKQLSERLTSLDKRFLVRSEGAAFIVGFPTRLEKGSTELDMLEALVRQSYVVDDVRIDVDSCLAVAQRDAGMSVADMVTGVNLAIKQAKSVGRGAETVFYEDDMQRAKEDMKEITAVLKQAIENDGFVVYYQPLVDVETNDVTAYEALLRLKDDAYPPAQFIPVAEMTGMIVDLGRIVTQRAVQQLATWKKRNKRLRPVSINYSPVQLKDEGYVDFLLGLLADLEVAPSLIKIEITENLFRGGEADKADALLERLMDAGISVALDDFGIGYTSISRILSIPAEVIKVDKSLVDMYMTAEKGDVIGNLALLVHGLGKKIYVEGVETREQMDICRKLGFDMVQGYYFSKPLLPERAAQFKPAKNDAA